MDSYYSDLTTACLHNAISELISARQYAKDADAPRWLIDSLSRTIHALQNRIDEVTRFREK